MATKICTKCGVEKEATAEFFHKKKSGKYGLNAFCKTCACRISNQYQKDNYEKNKQKYREYWKTYYPLNKEKIREYNIKNVERKREYDKVYNTMNREKRIEYVKNNIELIRERKREYVIKNKEKVRGWMKEWSKIHSDRRKEYKNLCYNELKSYIIKGKLIRSLFPKESITQELIEVLRAHILLKREIKNNKKIQNS